MTIVVKNREAIFFETSEGRMPAQEWLEELKDVRGKAKLYTRIRRAELGNFGNYGDLKGGLFEIKENFGPGYRIYFTFSRNDELIILLIGGDKGSQQRDIDKARGLKNDSEKQI